MQKWKEGINGIDVVQQAQTQMIGYAISIIGIIWGLVISIILKQYWLMVVLIGSIIITITLLIGVYQRYNMLKEAFYNLPTS